MSNEDTVVADKMNNSDNNSDNNVSVNIRKRNNNVNSPGSQNSTSRISVTIFPEKMSIYLCNMCNDNTSNDVREIRSNTDIKLFQDIVLLYIPDIVFPEGMSLYLCTFCFNGLKECNRIRQLCMKNKIYMKQKYKSVKVENAYEKIVQDDIVELNDIQLRAKRESDSDAAPNEGNKMENCKQPLQYKFETIYVQEMRQNNWISKNEKNIETNTGNEVNTGMRSDELPSTARAVSDQQHVCQHCEKHFCTPSDLNIHTRMMHAKDRQYQCPICKKKFKRRAHLNVHSLLHTGDKPYICTVCNKMFRQYSTLITHERTHTGYKPYACTECDAAFTTNSALVRHRRTHAADKSEAAEVRVRPFACNMCGKAFTKRDNLIRHKRIHTGDKPYKCTVCNKGLIDRSALIIHERTHTGEKPFACRMCDKAFAYRHVLIIHERLHTGDKPYACTVCEETFISHSHLSRHKRVHAHDLVK